MAQTRSPGTGATVAYDDLGTGEPTLLFLPGWCVDRKVFQDLFPCCTPHHRTLALDWRGHGESMPQAGDFGTEEQVEDARSVIDASGAPKVVPVAMSHAGWIAIELRRRLGAGIDRLVLLDWPVSTLPPVLRSALEGMQSKDRWRQTVEQAIQIWLRVDNPRLIQFVHQSMGAHGFAMWSRAAREIGAAYSREGSPLEALARLDPPPPTLHLHSQSADPATRAAQAAFAASHPWFQAKQLGTESHFPMFEAPEEIAAEIKKFCG